MCVQCCEVGESFLRLPHRVRGGLQVPAARFPALRLSTVASPGSVKNASR